MAEGSLHDRLRRLRREPPPAGMVENPALQALERSLLGDPGDGLSLKQRLERLVAAAARSRRAPATVRPAAASIEELVQGRRVENERGEYFVIETELPLEAFHGEVSLSRFRALPAGAVSILTAEPGFEGFDLGRAVFLDTETTGLAGGTGTAAFLIGVGFVAGDRFLVRQYFMRDYHEEAALLRGLAEDLAPFSQVVTFNGRTFDMPLLEARYRLNRDRYPLAEALHFDLLPPARRLWKARLLSCRLQSLEAELLGLRRQGDVPGEEIPRLYFDYVRRRDGRALVRVLEHNRMDVVSLAALSVLACQWVDQGWAEDPRDVYSLARVFEVARLFERSTEQYRRVVEAEPGPLRAHALLRLAARARGGGDEAAAAELWAQAAEEGDWRALRALAVYHEHRRRDLTAALSAVDEGLMRLADSSGPGLHRAEADFRRRRRRILLKQGGRLPANGGPRAEL